MQKKKLRKIPKEKELDELSKSELPKIISDIVTKLESDLKDKIKREVRTAFKDPELMSCLLENQSNHIVQFNRKTFQFFEKKIEKMIQNLNRITEVNEIAEETLSNVLLAIRQNEYLQAWYPEQHGYPAMKVKGQHPMKHKKKAKL